MFVKMPESLTNANLLALSSVLSLANEIEEIASNATINEKNIIYSGLSLYRNDVAMFDENKNIINKKNTEVINKEIKDVLQTICLFFSFSMCLKKDVSIPYVKNIVKKATYAYSSVGTLYSAGVKVNVYKGTNK